jgi:serine phosphatase RsbU (regulator of sigma subunit)
MDPAIAARWEELDLSEPTPLCEAMMSRRPVLAASLVLVELERRYPDMVADTVATSIGATASYPLFSAAGLVLGAVGQLRNSVRAYATEDPSPSSVLTRLNRMMCRLEPGEYATAIVAVWDEGRGTLLRSNAGHPPVLRCRPGEFGYLVPPPDGRLLGVSPDWAYKEQSKVLRPGTTMLFYTDGLVERRGHELLDGMSALLEFVESLDDLSPQAICDQVLHWRRAQGRIEDDVCLLAARLRKREGSPPTTG